MRTYLFQRDSQGMARVIVTDADVRFELYATASQRLFNHSPDGFEWGYSGSGPAQTALAVMLDYFESIPFADREKSFPNYECSAEFLALQFYQSFKFKFIAELSQSRGGEITGEQIGEWLGRFTLSASEPTTQTDGINTVEARSGAMLSAALSESLSAKLAEWQKLNVRLFDVASLRGLSVFLKDRLSAAFRAGWEASINLRGSEAGDTRSHAKRQGEADVPNPALADEMSGSSAQTPQMQSLSGGVGARHAGPNATYGAGTALVSTESALHTVPCGSSAPPAQSLEESLSGESAPAERDAAPSTLS